MKDQMTDSQLVEELAKYISEVAHDTPELKADDFDAYVKNVIAHFYIRPQVFISHFRRGYELLLKGKKGS